MTTLGWLAIGAALVLVAMLAVLWCCLVVAARADRAWPPGWDTANGWTYSSQETRPVDELGNAAGTTYRVVSVNEEKPKEEEGR